MDSKTYDLVTELVKVLEQAVEASGHTLSGPTDSRAAENGEPAWVCNARGVIADASAQLILADEMDTEHDPFLTDAEADGDALASAGWGTDEDYGGCSDIDEY